MYSKKILQTKFHFSLDCTPEEGNSASVKNSNWSKCEEAQTSTFDPPVSQQVKRRWSWEGAYFNISCFLIVCLAAPSFYFNRSPVMPYRITLPLSVIMLLSLASSTNTRVICRCKEEK